MFACGGVFAQTGSLSPGIANDLDRLANLYEEGLLTIEEFSIAKARLLELPKEVDSSITADDQSDNRTSPAISTTTAEEKTNKTVSTESAAIEDEVRLENDRSQSNITQAEPKSILLIQGNMLGMRSSTTGRAVGAIAGAAANIATGGLAGLAADVAAQSIASSILVDREIDQLPMPNVVTNEVTRQFRCDVEEYGGIPFDYVFSANAPLPIEVFPKLEELTLEEAREIWVDYFELNTAWQLNASDQVFWVIYEILADKQSVVEDLHQLEVEMSTFSLGIFAETIQNENPNVDSFLWLSKKPLVRGYSPLGFHDFVNSWISKEFFEKNNLDPSCSARSMIINSIEQSLNSESDLTEIEAFFERHGISYKRDRVARKF